MTAVIEVEHLGKRYGGTVAVADVSFSVADGEIFGILGPNGAGKTTTAERIEGHQLEHLRKLAVSDRAAAVAAAFRQGLLKG